MAQGFPKGRWGIVIALVVVGALVGLGGHFGFEGVQRAMLENCNEQFQLLNPNRRCNTYQRIQPDFDALQIELEKKIANWQQTSSTAHVSVYFRDLTNGPTFGINQSELFAPASLLKVPILMATLFFADQDPELLDRKVSFDGNMEGIENVSNPSETILPGVFYSHRQLLEKMIVYSDNVSTQLLKSSLRKVSPRYLERTFETLGIVPIMLDGEERISIKNYASIFRTLFNSSYISTESSQLALDLLTRSTFHQGLVAGLPQGTKVAHKYGIFASEDGKESQLHDCGIVYHVRSPYILCIMTRSPSLDTNAKIIQEIARTVDAEVESRLQDSIAINSHR